MQEILYLFEKLLVFISSPFISLVNISITASWAVLAVIIARFLLKKAPKWLSCALWSIVGLRLAFPFSLESVFSLIPSAQTVNPSAIYNDSFEVNTGFSAVDSTVNGFYNGVDVPAGAGVELAGIIAFVWLVGMFAMVSYAFISFLRLKLRLRTAVKKEGNIYHSEAVGSPFVLGVFRPKIYLPYNVDDADIPLVVAHEKAHIKRLDHIVKPLGYLLLSFHWFNPLMWVAYILLCRDIESACDEKVIKNLGEDIRRSYSKALLNASVSRRSVAACPLAFGEVGVKERIKGVMNYKKPAFLVVVAGVAVCIIAAVCFLTNPERSAKTDYTPAISDILDLTISRSIIEHNEGKYLDGTMSCESHKVLATQTSTNDDSDKIITVYLVALYGEYSIENGEIVEVSGGMSPLALTYRIGDDISNVKEKYALTEYWEPGMGSEYMKDLEAKFPKGINYDTQKYVDDLQADCKRQAVEYFGIDTTVIDRNNTEEYTTVMLEATSKAVFIDELNSTINTRVYPQTTVEVETFTDKVNDDEYTTVILEATSSSEVSEETNGVTADISAEAEPQLTGKVISATDKVIYMELTSDQSGIKKGTPVTVRLGSMLSYAPEIDASTLESGDIVTIIYDGRVMETYPLQIDAYAVYTVD